MDKSDLVSIGINEGLTQGMVRGIVQDKEGFMWFATKDGLNKYDGYQMIVYRHNPGDPYSLPDNSILQLLEDAQGNLWVGTANKGLFVFDRKREHFYAADCTEKNNSINDPVLLLQSVHGKLLVGKRSNVQIWDISRVHAKNYQEVDLANLPLLFSYSQQVNAEVAYTGDKFLMPLLLPDGSLWINSKESVWVFSSSAGKTYQFEKKLPRSHFGNEGFFFKVLQDVADSNVVYLVNPWKLIRYSMAENKVLEILPFELEKTPFLSYQSHIYFHFHALADSLGNIWIKTLSNTLFKFNAHTKSISKYQYYNTSEDRKKDGFSHYQLCAIDRNGIIWFGSDGFGILKYNPAIENFNRLPMVSIYSFWKDQSGNFITEKFIKYDKNGNPGEALTASFEQPKGAMLTWYSIIKSRNGLIWAFGIRNNLLELHCYDENNNLVKSVQLRDIKNFAEDFGFEDRQNHLWFVHKTADHKTRLVRLDKTTLKITAHFDFPLTENFDVEAPVTDWWEDKEGIFWLGTVNGLFRLNCVDNSWKLYLNKPNDPATLSKNKIYALCPDPVQPEKYLWVGTDGGGLNRFEYSTGKCRRFTEAEGLPNMVIYKMLTDNADNIWMSTNYGLSCLNTQTLIFRNFTQKDGLTGNEFNRHSGLKDDPGNLYFGGVDGITWFNPAIVLSNNTSAPLVLTGFSTSGIASSGGTDKAVFSTPIRYNQAITLPHYKNMFSISFAALDFSGSAALQYRYFLQGYEEDWKYYGPSNIATYTNLDPGSYTFRVAVLNKEGVWNAQEKPLQIIIHPPWWKTWWFISLMLFATGLMVYFFYRYRINQSLMMYKLRNKIASDLHDEIGSTLSSIVVYSEIIKEREKDDQLQSIAKNINDSSRTTLESMNDIVWSINPKNDSFDSILLRMRSVSNELLEAKNCALVFETEPGLETLKLSMIQRRNLFLIFKEALNNIVKYAEAANVHIMIAPIDGNISFRVADDGKGFDLQHIREGNGLLNLKNRATELKGKLEIKTSPGNGTDIELLFPV